MTLSNYTEEERTKAIQAILRRQAHDRQYYLKHREEHIRHVRSRRQGCLEEATEYSRQYRLEHKGEKLEYGRRYYQEHKEKMTKTSRQYYQEHKEELVENARQYHQGRPEVSSASAARRRTQIADSNSDFTAKEFRVLCETYRNKCVYCRSELPLTPDHAIPLSRGGSNGIENIVPACLACNLRKHTMTYDEYTKYLEEQEG